MSADNTSAFNCRPVAGSSSWSMHAYGEAIDVNPLVNPSVDGGVVDPPTGAPHADRSVPEPGKITAGSVAVRRLRPMRLGLGRQLDVAEGLPALLVEWSLNRRSAGRRQGAEVVVGGSVVVGASVVVGGASVVVGRSVVAGRRGAVVVAGASVVTGATVVVVTGSLPFCALRISSTASTTITMPPPMSSPFVAFVMPDGSGSGSGSAVTGSGAT